MCAPGQAARRARGAGITFASNETPQAERLAHGRLRRSCAALTSQLPRGRRGASPTRKWYPGAYGARAGFASSISADSHDLARQNGQGQSCQPARLATA